MKEIAPSINIDPDGSDSVPENYFSSVLKFLKDEPDMQQIFPSAMKQIAESAIDLKNLKPHEGLSYSLQQQSKHL